MNQCEHKWVYSETKKRISKGGYRPFEYIRVDRFFCEKCLKMNEVKETQTAWEQPLWY